MAANEVPRRRNYRAVHIGDLVGSFLQKRGFSRGQEHNAVFAAWERVVPAAIGERTRAVSFRNGFLTVVVPSAPLLEDLRCFRAGEFLELLNGELVRAGECVTVRKVDFRRA